MNNQTFFDKFLRCTRWVSIPLSVLMLLLNIQFDGLGHKAYAKDDPAIPTVTITSPEDNFATNKDTVDIVVEYQASANPNKDDKETGNVTKVTLNMDGVQVGEYYNEPAVKSGSHTFTVDISKTPDEIAKYQAFAWQGNPKAGHMGSSNILNVYIDKTPPVVTAHQDPAKNKHGWNKTDVTVSFTATDNLSGVVYVDPPVTLTNEGENQAVTGTARDRAGNVGSTTHYVSIDKTIPTSNISKPEENAALSTLTPEITAEYKDNLSGVDLDTIKLDLNAEDITSYADIFADHLSVTKLTKPEGRYTLKLDLLDKAENPADEAIRHFLLDVTPPDIANLKPEDGSLLANAQPEVSANYSDNLSGIDINSPNLKVDADDVTSKSEVKIDGIKYNPLTNLFDGEHTVELLVKDIATNIAKALWHFQVDITPPEIYNFQPADGVTTDESYPKIGADYKDNFSGIDKTTAKITVNGTDYTSYAEITDEHIIISPPEEIPNGEYLAEVTVKDKAGNTQIKSWRFWVNAGTIVEPAAGGTVSSADGSAKVEIPANALTSSTRIRVTAQDPKKYPDESLLPDTELLGVANFDPDNLTFEMPVKVTFPIEAPEIPGTSFILGLYDSATKKFSDTGIACVVNVDGLSVSAYVTHFSAYGALKNLISKGSPIGGGVAIPMPDLFTGTFSHSIDIAVPPGRKGLQPSLQLMYKSSSRNSWVGYGWELNPGYIERTNKKNGIPTYDDSQDTFLYITGGGRVELVNLIDNLYQAKIEGGFTKFYKQSDGSWTALGKDGSKMFFGTSANSRITNGSGIYLWAMDKAQDTNTNYISLSYTQDQAELYLDKIEYTGNENAGAGPKNTVDFILEARSDSYSSSRSGYKVTTAKRLKEVVVKANGDLARRYVLNYTQSINTKRSLLASVNTYGTDNTTQGPATIFTYQQGESTYNPENTWLDAFNDKNDATFTGDFNGDGLTDAGRFNKSTGAWRVATSDGLKFTPNSGFDVNFSVTDVGYPLAGDFNGDGLTDAGKAFNRKGPKPPPPPPPPPTHYDVYYKWDVGKSTGTSFTSPTRWADGYKKIKIGYSWAPIAGDFNADGLTDVGLYVNETGLWRVYTSTGSGFSSAGDWLDGFAGGDKKIFTGDFNADGLTDIGYLDSGSWNVALSNGKKFTPVGVWLSGFGSGKDPFCADFNNDGLTDAGYMDSNSGNWNIALSDGTKFTIESDPWQSGFGASSDWVPQVGDFNADGIIDAGIAHKSNGTWKVRTSNSNTIDLLTYIDNGTGGTTQVEYQASTKFGINNLPFVLPLVKSTAVTDYKPEAQTPETYNQTYKYEGAYFDKDNREFLGFKKTTATDPITKNYTESYFLQGIPGQQDPSLKGQIEKILSYDGTGAAISNTINTWEVQQGGTAPHNIGFPKLIKTENTIWENGQSLTVRSQFVYDSLGNLRDGIDEGDITVIGDEHYSHNDFYAAYTEFNRTKLMQLKDQDKKIVSKKEFEYDTKGNLFKEKAWVYNPITSEEQTAITQYGYDTEGFGNVVTTTNALNKTVTTEYENVFNTFAKKVTNVLDQSVIYVYDPRFGVATSTTDANGNTASTIYDALGRVTQVKNAYNQVVTVYEYPDFNTKITKQSKPGIPGEYFIKTEYADGLGRKYKTVSTGEDGASARDVVSEAFYNNRGLVEKESLAHYVDEDVSQIAWTKYEYDLRGRVKKTIADFPGTDKDAESSVDYVSPLYTEATDPKGHKKGVKKDVYDNVIEVKEFNDSEVYHTYYDYDTRKNLIKVTDNLNNVTEVFYDSLGRKIKMIDPDMGVWTYEYDLLGNLKKQTDAKTQVLEFEDDELNRLKKKIDATDPDNPVTLVTYHYDDDTKQNCIGRLSKIEDQAGVTEFFYDKLGREVKSKKTVDSSQYVVDREYDILDRLTKLTYPDNSVVQYAYDVNSGLLERVYSGATNYVQDITYNAKGQIKNIQYGNNTQTDYTYGNDLRLSHILTAGTTNLQDLNYDFDKNGNLVTLTDNLRSNTRTYVYDDLDRLTKAENTPQPGGGYTTFDYQYNSIGNMVYKSDVGTMTYGEGGAGPHALTSAGGYSYQYDLNGNMAVGKNKTLEYDIENRLKKVTEGATITSFAYDGDGGRVKKTRDLDSTIYIGSLFEKDSDGKTRKQIFAGANRVCSLESGGNAYYYHSDHLGSSSIITDKDGNQAQHLEYTPYGTIATNEGQDVARHKFTGKELDATGLYFYGARYYDPEIGRFITPDTIVQAPDYPQTLNRYTYCGNNPINYIDPSGHFWFIPLIIAIVKGAIIGAILGAASAAIMGGDIGKGALLGAIGGALFAGVSQLAQMAMKFAFTGTTQVSLLGKAAATANIASATLGGAAAGAGAAWAGGGDVGKGAWMGAAIAGGFSLIREVDYWMTSKMETQSARGKLNSEIPELPRKGGVGKYGGIPIGGNRFDPNVPFSEWVKNPGPLGGLQGSTGKFLFFNYSGNSVWHKIVETYSGAHDFLNSWAYDNATGYMRNLNVFERSIGAFTNPLNVAIATPIAVPSALPQTFNSAPIIVYGLDNTKEK